MVLNSTNWFAVEIEHGDDTDDWGGKKVKICVDPNVMFRGKRVGGLRLKAVPAVPI